MKILITISIIANIFIGFTHQQELFDTIKKTANKDRKNLKRVKDPNNKVKDNEKTTKIVFFNDLHLDPSYNETLNNKVKDA